MRSIFRDVLAMSQDNLDFATFKSRMDLSHNDIARIFGVSVLQSRAWAEGNATDDINRIARVALEVGVLAKSRGMTDADIQYYQKDKENYIKEAESREANRLRQGLNFKMERDAAEDAIINISNSLWLRLKLVFAPKLFKREVLNSANRLLDEMSERLEE